MTLLPVFLKLAGEPVLVVGAGSLAVSKIHALVQTGAHVHVVAPHARAGLDGAHWDARPFAAPDVADKRIVFAATGIAAVDREVARACRERGVLCNAIDDPPHCDFYTPAVVQRGDLQIAISTNGKSPALAQQLRQHLEREFDETWAARLDDLGRRRSEVLATAPPGEERKAVLHQQAREAMTSSLSLTSVFARWRAAIVRWLDQDDDRVALI